MDIRALDLALLPVLDALLRHGSVSAAARALDMSQPATSHALKRLREMLGDPLFVRTGRGVAPTERARRLGPPVRAILDRVRDEVLAGGAFEPERAARSFTLNLSDVGSFVLWPRIVAAVREAAPAVSLRLTGLEPARLAAALESGDVDLAVGAYPHLPGALFQQRLFERKYVCLMRAGHPLAGRRAGIRQFAAAAHVVVRAPSRMQERIDAGLAARGLARRVAMELPSYLMLPPLLEAGDYLAVVPGQLADAFAGRGALATAGLPLPLPAVVIRQYWHRRAHADAGSRWLRGVIGGLFGEPGAA
ncbi:MAG: LysR family transcriptional regulator [Burkholderiales bacterium]|nr:LysR family transcriptional regulator [Burkholderiales bacterium]